MPGRDREAPSRVEVLHRDAHLLAVMKPAGLPTTAPDGGRCLVEVVRGLDARAPRLHPSSRLDAEVTGVVIFARTRRATEHLLAARRAGRYRRLYVALASAAPTPPTGVFTWSIGLDPRDPRRRRAVDRRLGGAGEKEAETEYETVELGQRGALIHLRPRTGRTHQIRVHAAAAGVPLLGDVPYGGPRRVVLDDGRVLMPRRVMLHCAEVAIPSVEGERELRIEAPWPKDLAELWSKLRR